MKEHELKVRVYYEDTDAGGIVYYANYLKFAERARTEMLRDLGYNHGEKFNQTGLGFAVASANIKYKMPAKLDDLLTVKSQVAELGGASMQMRQNIYCGDALIAEIEVVLVFINQDLKPVRIPQEIKDIFGRGE